MKKQILSLAGAFSIGLLAASTPASDFKPDFSHCDVYRGVLRNIPLSGWWKLKKLDNTLDNPKDDEGQKGNWQAEAFQDAAWPKEMVPGNLHLPFAERNPDKKTRNWGGVAYYRTSFTLPALQKGEHAILRFDEITGNAEIYLNGKKIGSKKQEEALPSRGTWFPELFDATRLVKPGKNTLVVRFYHSGKSSQMTWGTGPAMGITGNVWMEIRPDTWTRHILIDPKKDLQSLHVECIVDGNGKTDAWTAVISEVKSGKEVASKRFGTLFEKDGRKRVASDIRIPNAKQWTPETPFLYLLTVRNEQGKIAGAQRFGMRTVEVKDGDFKLNGKSIMLRGLCTDLIERGHPLTYVRHVNPSGLMKKYLTGIKKMNVNHIRLHTRKHPPIVYDLMDELGFFITDEIDYPLTMIPNPKRADEIAIPGMEKASRPDGTLRPEYVEKLKKRFFELYSHPSICTFSFGNEIRNTHDRTGEVLNNTYKVYKRIDGQNRPCTLSSGRYWKAGNNIQQLREYDTTDYLDPHDYTGSINSSPVTYVRPVAQNFIDTAKKHYKPMLPIINGETVYANAHHYPGIYNPMWKNRSDAQPDWDRLETHFNTWKQSSWLANAQAMMSFHWVRNFGLKSYIYDRVRLRGILTDRVLAPQRELWPDWDGYENLSEYPFKVPASLYPFENVEFVPDEDFEYIKEVNAPVFGSLGDEKPNRWTGDRFETQGMVINNRLQDLGNASMRISVAMNGKPEVPAAEYKLGEMASNGKKRFPVSFPLPKETGCGEIIFRTYDGTRLENTRRMPLNLRNRAETISSVKTDKKIALYDAGAVFEGLGEESTADLLSAYGVPVKQIDSFKDLSGIDLLIIGANSFDENVRNEAKAIREYAERGGRILVFEQTVSGRIPFLPELCTTLVGPGQFTEILKFDHAAMKGMTQGEFSFWNQPDRSIYRSYIAPFSRAALTLAGDASEWGSDNFGMAVCHLKLGKGDILFSQNEVTRVYRRDSGAAKFVRNLLETMTDNSTRAQATDFLKLPPLKVTPPIREKTVTVSLKNAANRAFADEKEGDGKGGWSDQGPSNDLRTFPLGRGIYAGVPFDILNPAGNGNKACVVVSDRSSQKISPKSRQIRLDISAAKVYFLHAGAWMPEESDKPVGWYEITGVSGKTQTVPLFAGREICDWWGVARDKATKSASGWTAIKPAGGAIGLGVFEWKNPTPEDPIKHIVLRSAPGTVIGLAGITVEKADQKNGVDKKRP